MFDEGDEEGPFGPRNHIVHGWRLRGAVDVGAMRVALDDVVLRNESLRTSIVRDGETRYQRVHPPGPVDLEPRDFSDVEPGTRDRVVAELLNEIEAGEVDSRRLPLVHATLGRFTDEDWILVLIVHHTGTDGWSMRLIIRELAACYATRRGFEIPDRPEPRQYREFTTWQRAGATGATTTAARAFWRETLRDALVFTFPTDRPRSEQSGESTSAVYRFSLDAELTSRTLDVARATRSTPFMVLLAVFELLIQDTTGRTDIVVPTFTPGRGEERFWHTVGTFFNFLPLRTDIAGCATFRDVVERTRATCVAGYSNEIPTTQIFEEAHDLMDHAMDENQATGVFQVFPFPFALDGEVVGDLEYAEVRRRLLSQPVGSDVPDGMLWTLNLDPAGDMLGAINYKSHQFDESTIARLVIEFGSILRQSVTAPDGPLATTR